MHSRVFKVAFMDSLEKFEEYTRNESSELYGLFKYVVKAMRFSYVYSAETEVSQLLPNGTWMGFIGSLNRSEVDYVPANFVLTEERWDSVAYIYPHLCTDTTFVSKKPRYNPEVMAIFQTLSASVWLSLLISIIMITLVLYMVLRYRYTLGDVLFHVLAIGLSQKGNIIPKKAIEILLLWTWMLVMMLFTTCFKSVLLSFLSFPPLTGVRKVPELAAAIRAGKYGAMASEDDYTPIYLQGSKNEGIRLIAENSLKNPRGDPTDLINKSFNPNMVSIFPRAFITHAKPKLYISKESMGLHIRATAVRKDFCCRDEMDMIVHRFLAAGINLKIRSFNDFKKAFKYFSELPDDDIVRKIPLIDLSGAFIILIVGHFLSVCVLVIELAIKK